MEYLLVILTFCFGAVIGSFLNVVILRLPKEQTLTGRSHCPVCGHTLGLFDLVPIFSFLFLRGRCHYCKTKISWRYFILETLTGLLFVLAYLKTQPLNLPEVLILLKFLIVIATLVVVFVVDLEHFLILDSVVFPVSLIILLMNLSIDYFSKTPILSMHSNLVSGLLGAAFLWLLFFLVWYFSKGQWLGFGDVKLAVLLGLILGWPLIFVGFMLAVISGGIISTCLLIFSGKTLKTQIPFGTFLAFGTILAMFYGEKLLSWYLAILGF
jgi:leader peptidase (prepilin peptidase) / N-methyltransferase